MQYDLDFDVYIRIATATEPLTCPVITCPQCPQCPTTIPPCTCGTDTPTAATTIPQPVEGQLDEMYQ